MDFINFENKKILVTGASSGIGRATAILLSKLNAKVILTGRNEIELNNTLNLMENKNKHTILSFDITHYENYDNFLDKCVEDNSKINGFVFSSGIAKVVLLQDINENDIDDVFNVNIKSFLIFVSKLSKRKYSEALNVVAISSIFAHYPSKANAIYSVSKGALESAVTSMAMELSKKNGRINSIISGLVKTNMTKNIGDDKIKIEEERSILNLASADDIANAIVFLLSDRAKCITGRSIFVDSGFFGQSIN